MKPIHSFVFGLTLITSTLMLSTQASASPTCDLAKAAQQLGTAHFISADQKYPVVSYQIDDILYAISPRITLVSKEEQCGFASCSQGLTYKATVKVTGLNAASCQAFGSKIETTTVTVADSQPLAVLLKVGGLSISLQAFDLTEGYQVVAFK